MPQWSLRQWSLRHCRRSTARRTLDGRADPVIRTTAAAGRDPADVAHSGKYPRQPETRHHADLEAGELGDPIAGEHYHDQASRPPCARRGVQGVHPTGWTAVRPRVDEPKRPASRVDDGLEEADGGVTAVVLEGEWRHLQPDVLTQNCDQLVHVVSGEGVDVRLDQLALLGRACGRGGWLRPTLGQGLIGVESGPGTLE